MLLFFVLRLFAVFFDLSGESLTYETPVPEIVFVVRVPPLAFFVYLKPLKPVLQPIPDLLKFNLKFLPILILFLYLQPILIPPIDIAFNVISIWTKLEIESPRFIFLASPQS